MSILEIIETGKHLLIVPGLKGMVFGKVGDLNFGLDELHRDIKIKWANGNCRKKWDRKYPSILLSWDVIRAELTTFFNYPEQIRHLVYTIHSVEAYHRIGAEIYEDEIHFPDRWLNPESGIPFGKGNHEEVDAAGKKLGNGVQPDYDMPDYDMPDYDILRRQVSGIVV